MKLYQPVTLLIASIASIAGAQIRPPSAERAPGPRDRAVWARELDLANAQKIALRDFVLWNSRPENTVYRYDYYPDNCSTRVRDALDHVLGGVIRATFSGRKTNYTYRSETLRLTQ